MGLNGHPGHGTRMERVIGILLSPFAKRVYPYPMVLKPQDLLVVLKLWVGRGQTWTYPILAKELGISLSEVHGAVKRAAKAGFLVEPYLTQPPNPRALREFLVHGAKFAFPADRGGMTRGVPTAHAAAPLNAEIVPDGEPPPVWPFAEGTERGLGFSPLYPAAPAAALRDPALHEMLSLLDAIRGGRARERQRAIQLLEDRLK